MEGRMHVPSNMSQDPKLVIYRKQAQWCRVSSFRLPSLKKQSAVKIDTDAWIS